MKLALLLTLGLVLPTLAHAESFDSHVRGSAPDRSATATMLKPLTYQQEIDHSAGAGSATFAQRYWIDSSFATKADQAPVIFHICGEGDVDQSYFLDDNALGWAKSLGAHVVYLEHRYYGKSLPFDDLSSDHLKFLTLDNVIEDFASFQKWIAQKNGWSGKWISVGGSYSGTLSAIYRQRHPELIVGALASSAPMISGVGDSVGSQDDLGGLSSDDPTSSGGGRQWVYQACTTFGFWMADGPSIDSNLQNPSAWLCQQLFGDVALVNPAAYNQSYDAPFLSSTHGAPSNILFTYGGEDVWTKIGLGQQTNANPGIQILTIAGAGHHYDLNRATSSDTDEVLNARARFTTLARKWLGLN